MYVKKKKNSQIAANMPKIATCNDLLVRTNWFPQNSWTGILITTHCIMGKTIRRAFKSVQDLALGWLPWEQESILLTVAKNDGFSEMKCGSKAEKILSKI